MRPTLLVAGLATCALASTAAYAVPELRYEGPRLSFAMPEGTVVKEVPDIAADYALDLVPGRDVKLPQTSFRLLLSNNRVADLDVEGVASAWRDARLRNRSAWGVKKRAEDRLEVTHIGSRRFVRMSDQMGSALGASRQLMICGSVQGRLLCGITNGPPATEKAAEALLVRFIETIAIKKTK